MFSKTPLAWRNLTHDRRRLLVAISGVGFAVVLIFIELGFLNALLESTVQILRKLNGELVIVSAAKYAMPAREQFELRRVTQAAGVKGVQAAFPIYLEGFGVLRQQGARGFPIRVLAFDLEDNAVQLGTLAPAAADFRAPGTALTDTANRSKYRIPRQAEDLNSYDAEFEGQAVKIVGQFHLGVDFANDGNLVMSPNNFAHFFPHRAFGRDPLSMVDLAVVQVQPGENVLSVKQRLCDAFQSEAPHSDVNVFTRDELIDREMQFWRKGAPVGFIFMVGVYMGFVVGVIICYQIIYSDIADHMGEFATLKAMGYTNSYFVYLVLRQSLYLSVMGFLPGALLSYGCYLIMSALTGLTMQMTLDVAVMVFAVTMLMCVVSGLLAVRKLLSLDPAELF
jgi:putative ABC transport system permease protein